MRAFGYWILIGLLVTLLANHAAHAEEDTALFLTDGDSIARATLETIDNSKESVYSVEFLARDDEFGRMKMALLRKKAREGVAVHMHVDALHLMVDPHMIAHLIAEGVKVRVYNEFKLSRLFSFDYRDHSKLLVVDGNVVRTGDTNTGNEYVKWGNGHHMQSRDVLVKGPVGKKALHYAKQMFENKLSSIPIFTFGSQAEYEAQNEKYKSDIQRNNKILSLIGINIDAPDVLARPKAPLIVQEKVDQAASELDRSMQAYEKLRIEKGWDKSPNWYDTAAVPIKNATFHHDPIGFKGKRKGIDRAVVEFMKGAKEKLTIVSPYMLPTTEDMKIIAKLAKKGVKVDLYTNAISTGDNDKTQQAYELKLKRIAALGNINVYEYKGSETWHAKMLVRDNIEMMVMGYNLDGRSKKINLETGLYGKGREYVQQMQTDFEKFKSKFELVATQGKLTPNKQHQQNWMRSCGQFYGASGSRFKNFLLRVFEFKL